MVKVNYSDYGVEVEILFSTSYDTNIVDNIMENEFMFYFSKVSFKFFSSCFDPGIVFMTIVVNCLLSEVPKALINGLTTEMINFFKNNLSKIIKNKSVDGSLIKLKFKDRNLEIYCKNYDSIKNAFKNLKPILEDISTCPDNLVIKDMDITYEITKDSEEFN